jgi:hypothetical protein
VNLRAQDAGRGLRVRADMSRIAAVDRRRGCEVDYIAAEELLRRRSDFAAIVDDIAKLFGAARALPRRRDRAAARACRQEELLEL